MITRDTRPLTNPERRAAWAALFYQRAEPAELGGITMIQIDQRRHARALERVRTALRANPALSEAQQAVYLQSFERGWAVASGSAGAQHRHVQALCDQISRAGQGVAA